LRLNTAAYELLASTGDHTGVSVLSVGLAVGSSTQLYSHSTADISVFWNDTACVQYSGVNAGLFITRWHFAFGAMLS